MATTRLLRDALDGCELIPHPRFTKGVNLKKFLHGQPTFDIGWMVTGHAIVPFLEDGEVTDRKQWRAVTQPLGSRLGLYALWFS